MLEKQVTERHIPNTSSCENKHPNKKTPHNPPQTTKNPPNKKTINFCTVTAVEFQIKNETEGGHEI